MTTQEQEQESVLDALRDAGCRITPQRRAVVKEVMSQSGHISATGLAERVAKKLPGVNTATVYRTLWLLDKLKILSHAHLEDGVAYHHSRRAGHVHLTCSECGRSEALEEKDVASLASFMEKTNGFSPDFTHFAIAGICRTCRASSSATTG